MNILLKIPLLAIVLAAFNIILFSSPNAFRPDAGAVFELPLASGGTWFATLADIIIISAVLLLYLELFKATRTDVGAIIEHILSLLVFLTFMVEFIVVPGAGNSTCVILMLICLLDVVGGFTISISTARRDMSFGGG